MDAGGRDVGVDVARGLALLSMYVAHTASRADPALVPLLANLLTAALFATLVGVGGGLARRGSTSARREVAAPLVRGAALVGLGLLLTGVGSSVIVILVHLGLLTWLVAGLARCPTRLVAAVGAGLLVLSPTLLEALAAQDAHLTGTGAHWQSLLLDLTVTGDTYRLTSLLAWAAVGLLLARILLPVAGWVRQVVAGAVALAAAALVIVVDRPVPYSGSHVEVVVDALLAGGVLLVAVGLTRLVRGRGVGWIADLGRMTLTLYTAQVLALALLEQRLRPGEPPYGLDVLLALTAGSVLVAVAWGRSGPARRWGRGPLEGAVERVVDLVGGRRTSPFRVRP